jgi:hypothetical protein
MTRLQLLRLLLFMFCYGCAGKSPSLLSTNVQYKGRTISGLKEGAWVKYHGDTVVEVNYYYGDSLLFALPKADFVTTNFCIDSLSLCWKYPRSWT